MRPSPRIALLATTLAAVVCVATPPAVASRRSPRAEVARRFLADTAPLAPAAARFEAIALRWLGDPGLTHASANAAAAPLVQALGALEGKLQRQSWPATLRGRVVMLERAGTHLVEDLRALGRVDLAKTALWEAPLLSDQVTMTAAVNAVRRGLGLHPLSS